MPSRHSPYTMRLRLRLPNGLTLRAVRINGHPRPINKKSGTVNLSGLRGSLDVVALLSRS